MTGPTKTGWEQKIAEAGAWAEGEVRRVVTFLNDEVVPEVRHEGSRALRVAADRLTRLAEQMERRGPGRPGAPPSEDDRTL